MIFAFLRHEGDTEVLHVLHTFDILLAYTTMEGRQKGFPVHRLKTVWHMRCNGLRALKNHIAIKA